MCDTYVNNWEARVDLLIACGSEKDDPLLDSENAKMQASETAAASWVISNERSSKLLSSDLRHGHESFFSQDCKHFRVSPK